MRGLHRVCDAVVKSGLQLCRLIRINHNSQSSSGIEMLMVKGERTHVACRYRALTHGSVESASVKWKFISSGFSFTLLSANIDYSVSSMS